MNGEPWKMDSDLSRRLSLAMLRIKDRGGKIGPLCEEFEASFDYKEGDRILERSGVKGMHDFLDSEMVRFFELRAGLKGDIPKERSMNPKKSGRVSVVYDRAGASEVIQDYLKKHPGLPLKDATLAVAKERPELFRRSGTLETRGE